MSKNNRKDPAWKYGTEITKSGGNGDKKTYIYMECNFCKKSITGGVKRMKDHLACTHKNVAPCPEVPDNVKKEIKDYMEVGERKRHLSNEQFEDLVEGGSYYNDEPKSFQRGLRGPMDRFVKNTEDDDPNAPNPKMTATKAKEMRNKVACDVGRFFFENAIPFNCARTPSFISMCRSIGSYGRGFAPPSPYELKNWILNAEVDSTKKIVEDIKKTWKTTGVSILSDGWTSTSNSGLINFIVNNPHGTMFLKSIDASKQKKDAALLFKLLDDVVEEVGEEIVVQVVTDNASNYKAAGRMLMEKREHLYWTPCAAHCIDLMLERLSELPQHKNALLKAKKVSNYIHNHQWVDAMVKTYTRKEVIRPGATRFATAYMTLCRIFELKKPLQSFFTSEEWVESRYAKTSEGKGIKKIIMKDQYFWPSVAYAVRTTFPLVRVLKFVDGEKVPAMGFMYEAMDFAKEDIAENLENKVESYKEIWDIIDEKWNAQLHRDLHSAGCYLNPRHQYADTFSTHGEIIAGLYNCMARLIPDDGERKKASIQTDIFVTKAGLFGLQAAQNSYNERTPAMWWTQFGCDTPELQRFAIKVLSLTCSASACEHNWSTFNHIHTKKRNRLATKRLEQLVYVNFNKRLSDRRRQLTSPKDVVDHLVRNEVSSDDEWVADYGGESENEVPPNEDEEITDLTQAQSQRKRKLSAIDKEKRKKEHNKGMVGKKGKGKVQDKGKGKVQDKGKGKKILQVMDDDEETEWMDNIDSEDEEDDFGIRYEDSSTDDGNE